jgi:RNA polymerase sigma-70 factor (ECF subfamily)
VLQSLSLLTLQLVTEAISLNQFEELFKSIYSDLCAKANQYLQDLDAAEETVQEVFVKFWEARESIEIKQSAKAYLSTAVKNSCLNQLKHLKIKEDYKQHNQREIELEQNRDSDDSVLNSELNDKIKMAVDALPQSRKEIFLLSRYEGLKYKEIAEKLNISIKTVENQMGSALKYLKTELSEYLVTLVYFILFWL